MTNPPPPSGQGPEWVDPDAPTGLAPQQQRPQPRGWQPSPGPHHVAPPTPPRTPAWPHHPGHAPTPGPWPHQPPPQAPSWTGAPGTGLPHGALPHPGGQPPTKNRKPLIIGAIAVAVVTVVVIAIVAFSGNGNGNGGPDSSLSASDTAKAYLDALSSGDAAKALSFGNAQPANMDLLTDEILRKQLAKMPISNIRVLDEDKTIAAVGMSRVHVAVNFGQTVNDVTLSLKLGDDNVWKLDSAVVKIDPPFTAVKDLAAQTITVFGKEFTNGSIYTFPGYQDVGSTNKYIQASAEPLLLDRLQTTYTAANLSPQLTLNDAGRKAIQEQLTALYAKCQGNLLQPPGCPVQTFAYDAVDGTASWGPADLSRISIGDPYPDMTVYLSGSVTIPLSYRTTRGETKQDNAIGIIGGDADITKTPPRLNSN